MIEFKSKITQFQVMLIRSPQSRMTKVNVILKKLQMKKVLIFTSNLKDSVVVNH